MKFGYYLPCHWPNLSKPGGLLYKEYLEQAELADELGFAEISIPEHHFINYITCPSPLLLAQKVADRTRRARIVTAVVVLPFYHPLRLAGEIALADNLTGGRLEVGVGLGAFKYEFERMGVPVEERRDRFRECLDILVKAWSETSFSYDGKFYQLPKTTVLPRPLQIPHPPIWIAAQSPQTIEMAVELGYPVMNTPLRSGFEQLKQTVTAFDRAVVKHGQTRANMRLSILRMGFVGETAEVARRQLEFAFHNHRMFVNVYNGPSIVNDGAVAPLESDFSPDEVWENLILGDPELCIAKLRQYETLGIDVVHLNMSFGSSHRDILASMRLFGERVMPAFAKAIQATERRV